MKVIKATRKILYLMRGLPGSGKSTKAKELAGDGVSYSTDDFFINPKTGKYEFNGNMIGKNHALNAERTEKAMKEGISPIVVDNTNVKFFEMKKYVLLAQKYGYDVEFHEADTPWAWNADELSKRNTHGVPKDVIEKMLAKWEKNPTVENVLRSKIPGEK